jgi:hypothetical protein
MLHLLRTCSSCTVVSFTVSVEEAWRDTAKLVHTYESMMPAERAAHKKPTPLDFRQCANCGADYRQFRDFADGDRLDRGSFPPILAPEEEFAI